MNLLTLFHQVIDQESLAISQVKNRIRQEHLIALEVFFESLLSTGGSLHFCGVGKSGIVAEKLASTFSSLGLPSFVLHPVEALHGDLGRVRDFDGIIFISKSATTEEIQKLLPYIKIPMQMRVGLFGNLKGKLNDSVGLTFDCSVEKEACLNNLAPTTSTTVTLAVGDALAVCFEHLAGVSKEKFAIHHPAGRLGKSLSLKVKDIMIKKENCAMVTPQCNFRDVLLAMTNFPVSMCAVVDSQQQLLGIFVEGDIRRILLKNKNIESLLVEECMTKNPKTIQVNEFASVALEMMESTTERFHNVLPVVEDKKFVGVIRHHELF